MQFVINFGQVSVIQEHDNLETAIHNIKSCLKTAFEMNKQPAKVKIESIRGKLLRTIETKSDGSVQYYS